MPDFTKMIREIDAELNPEFHPGAFQWSDRNLGTLHTDAVNRFDRAYTECTARCDSTSLQVEADAYKEAILKILRAYKAANQVNEQTSFLEALRGA